MPRSFVEDASEHRRAVEARDEAADDVACSGRLDEQAPIELECKRALTTPADRIHLGDDLGPPAVEPICGTRLPIPRCAQR